MLLLEGLGVAVFLKNLTRLDASNLMYATAAGSQIDYLLHYAPRSAEGAISHRQDDIQLWADFIYMAPPLLAYYGAVIGGGDGIWMLQQAYEQCSLYRDQLRDGSSGLWKHAALGTYYQDPNRWLTGNGWAAAGMIRVAESIKRSPIASDLQGQLSNLTSWVGEIVGAAWKHQQSSGALLNYIDADAGATFEDAAGTALLAAATLRHAVLAGDKSNVDAAKKALNFVVDHIDDDGWLRGTVDPYTFDQPLADGSHSPEGQAFVLLMHTAWRDYLAWLVLEILGNPKPTSA
jgi:rhamnogalacturonyl hydrolase YesR